MKSLRRQLGRACTRVTLKTLACSFGMVRHGLVGRPRMCQWWTAYAGLRILFTVARLLMLALRLRLEAG